MPDSERDSVTPSPSGERDELGELYRLPKTTGENEKTKTATTLMLRQLNITISLSIIIVTSVLCASLAVVSSDKAFNDTVESRDKAANECFDAGEQNILQQTNAHLDAMSYLVQSYINEFLESHRRIIASDIHIIRNFDPKNKLFMDALTSSLCGQYVSHKNVGMTIIGVIRDDNYTRIITDDGNPTLGMWTQDGGTLMKGLVTDDCEFISNLTINSTDGFVTGCPGNEDANCLVENEDFHIQLFYKLAKKHVQPGVENVKFGFLTLGIGLTTLGVFEGGVVFGGISLRDISQVFNTVSLGTHGRIYGVVRSSWVSPEQTDLRYNIHYNQTHRLIGASVGDVYENVESKIPMCTSCSWAPRRPVDSTDHIISATARYIENIPGKYESLLQNKSLHQFSLMNDDHSNHTHDEFVAKVSSIESKHGIDWYIVIVLDSDFLYGEVNERVLQTKKEIDAIEEDVVENLRGSRILLLTSVTVSSVVLIMASMGLVFVIMSPLKRLERNMRLVSEMRLDEINHGEYSSMSEVKLVQTAFSKMVNNLELFREFLPASVFRSEENELSTADQSSHPSTAMRSQSSCRSHQRPMLVLQPELRLKHVSMGIINFVGFLTKGSETELQHELCDYISTIAKLCQDSRGVPEGFYGDKVCLHWNAIVPVTSHGCLASNCCYSAQQLLLTSDCKTSVAVVSGEVSCGNMGCTGMRKFTFLGSLVPWLMVLERHNSVFGTDFLVDQYVQSDITTSFVCKLLESLYFEKHSSLGILVYQVVNPIPVTSPTWMYKLGDEINPFTRRNLVLQHYFNLEWDQALPYLTHSLVKDIPQLKGNIVRCKATKAKRHMPLYPPIGLQHF